MKTKQILFTAPKVAELCDSECREPGAGEVLVEMHITTISTGTEKANLVGDLNVDASRERQSDTPIFPRALGYSGAGVVKRIGTGVTTVKAGDRVVVVFGVHSDFCTVQESRVVPIDDAITFSDAALMVIASFPLAALRKTRLEIGEPAIVMGLGILGQFAIAFCRAAGAVPVVGVDPLPEKRALALRQGADYVLDPSDTNFIEQARSLTGRGARVAIEVTGRGEALNQVLGCMERQGRVALLGCTRDADFTVDYYRKVHYPGITLIGAHTSVRPDFESYPGYWTYRDDISAMLRLIREKRVDFSSLVTETHSPNEAGQVYLRLAKEQNFPVGVQFDWTK